MEGARLVSVLSTAQSNDISAEKWPKTASGLPSTAGTTASIAFIRRGKIYIGHVGDSAIVLGYQDQDNPDIWRAEPLTRDHKPESLEENERITQSGGKVVSKSGVPRVVWNRPRTGHKGPVRRSTHIDEIPFLAVARSLGDLWSYNSEEDVFVVSPEPDIRVYPVDITRHRCLVLATDGCWNMLTPQNAISSVCAAEKTNEQHMLAPVEGRTGWINPSKQLVDCAVDRWNGSKLRADNTSVVTVMLDPPGPPRAQVLKTRKRELAALNAGKELPTVPGVRGSVALVTNTTEEAREEARESLTPTPPPPAPASGEDCVSSPPADTVQCNEISSSEDTDPISSQPSPPPLIPPLARRRPRSLARELNSLRLQCPESPAGVSTRSQTVLSPKTTPRILVKRQTAAQRSAKKKLVGKPQTADNSHSNLSETSAEARSGLERLREDSDSDNSVTPRRLRSTLSPAPGSASRKRPAAPRTDTPTRKSPRKSPRVISVLPPRVTYSKRARVLKLKKR